MRTAFRVAGFLLASAATTSLAVAAALYWMPEYRGSWINYAIISAETVAQFSAVLHLGMVWLIHIPYFVYKAYKGTVPRYGSYIWAFLTLVVTFILFEPISFGPTSNRLTALLTILATLQSLSFGAILLLVSRFLRKDVRGKTEATL